MYKHDSELPPPFFIFSSFLFSSHYSLFPTPFPLSFPKQKKKSELYMYNLLWFQTRQKVLVTAFLRALKDPFPPARIAAIDAMGATHVYFSNGDLSARILPALCTVTIDTEKPVRDKTFKTIRLFLAKLEKFSEDPQAAAEQEKIEGNFQACRYLFCCGNVADMQIVADYLP